MIREDLEEMRGSEQVEWILGSLQEIDDLMRIEIGTGSAKDGEVEVRDKRLNPKLLKSQNLKSNMAAGNVKNIV